MKMRSQSGFTLFSAGALAAFSIGGSVSTACANTVDIQFEGINNYGSAGSFNGNQGAYTGDSVASPTWNVFPVTSGAKSGSQSNLFDSTGATTTDTVSFTADSGYSSAVYFPVNNVLLDGFLVAKTSQTVTLTNLTPGGAYQLYLYAQNGGWNNNGSAFGIITGSGSPAIGSNAVAVNSGSGSTFTLNTNYVIFNATADVNGTLVIGYGKPASSNGEGDFNGLQITSTSVPEPASLVLLGIGALGLLMLRKRQGKIT